MMASLVLPMGFGGGHPVSTRAWHGDKILGAAVAAELRTQGVTGHANLTKRFAFAVSNDNMAAHLDELLTPSLLALVPPASERAAQVHDCGTMVEACIDQVHAAGDMAAVTEVAVFLLAHPLRLDSTGVARPMKTNTKGRLLELGGAFSGFQMSGRADHAPLYHAEASLRDLRASAQGLSRKRAEQEAAAALLAQMDEDS